MHGIVLADSVMTDIGPQSQWSPLAPQNIDLCYTIESHGSSPPLIPGSLPVVTIREDTSKRETSLPADQGDSVPSTPQDSADSTLHGLGHAAEYVVPSIQGL